MQYSAQLARVSLGILVALGIGMQATAEERLCTLLDAQYGQCLKEDLLLITPPAMARTLGETSDSSRVATAIAEWCDVTKPVILVSPSAAVCTYRGSKRGGRTEIKQ